MLRCHGIGVKDHTSLSVLPTLVHFENSCPPEQCWKVLGPESLPNDLKKNPSSQVWPLTQITCSVPISIENPRELPLADHF